MAAVPDEEEGNHAVTGPGEAGGGLLTTDTDVDVEVQGEGEDFVIPRIPASSGALIFDGKGRLLVVNPTYKAHWTIPGGIMEADGETPWEACRREVAEEVGLEVSEGRLVAVDFLRPKGSKPGGMRFLFDCGALGEHELGAIRLQEEELSEYRLVKPVTALELLSGPLRRRVGAALESRGQCVYLEDGRTVL
jgi:8-oxo-dGTP diphosphatase